MLSFTLFFFSLLAIIPAYYSEDECNIRKDIEIFDELLLQDIVVKTFLEKYPRAIPFLENIDESIPPKADIKYGYENDEAKIEFRVYVREVGPTPDDCFVPVYYTYKYEDTVETIDITYYSSQQQEMLDFLDSIITTSPYKQIQQGVKPENVKCKDTLQLYIKDGIKPLCLKSETYEKLMQRGYF